MDPKEKKLQGHRLRMTGLSILNWVVPSLAIGLYAWVGEAPWSLAVAFSVAGIGTTAIFALVIALGWNLRLKDKGLLLPQLVVACGIELIFLAIAPKFWAVFLISIFGAYNFAVIRFDPRQFKTAWLVFGAATAIALYIGRDEFGYPGTSGADIVILWLFFFLAMQRLTSIGAQFSHLRAQLSEKNRLLSESLEKIQELAIHDDLTGAYNRRYFMQLLTVENERAIRTGQEFCVAILDLDHFKHINDRFGHLVGDAVLREFSKTVQSTMRSTDRFARYGGEEFVLLLTATTSVEVAGVAVERIRLAVEQRDWSLIAPGLSVTFSAGIASSRPKESLEELLGRADHGLYDAKRAGRNRFFIA